MCDILRGLGADVRVEKDGKIYVLADRMTGLARLLRHGPEDAGFLLSLWAFYSSRFGKAEVGMPGGCDIGPRPIDQHVKAFEALGATVDIEHGTVFAHTEGLKGNEVYFDKYSVGATINAILCAVKAEGQTLIVNAAKEPHVVDLASYLNSMGADIRGAGTDEIKVRGVEYLHGSEYIIIPDQIEAGTYMIAAASTGGGCDHRRRDPQAPGSHHRQAHGGGGHGGGRDRLGAGIPGAEAPADQYTDPALSGVSHRYAAAHGGAA